MKERKCVAPYEKMNSKTRKRLEEAQKQFTGTGELSIPVTVIEKEGTQRIGCSQKTDEGICRATGSKCQPKLTR